MTNRTLITSGHNDAQFQNQAVADQLVDVVDRRRALSRAWLVGDVPELAGTRRRVCRARDSRRRSHRDGGQRCQRTMTSRLCAVRAAVAKTRRARPEGAERPSRYGPKRMNSEQHRLWTLALSDTGLDESEARLYFATDQLPGGGLAEAFAPGQEISGSHPLTAVDRTDATQRRSTTRVVIDSEGLPDTVTWAIVRHELEHRVQHRACGLPISQVGYAAEATLIDVFGIRPGAAALYQEIPTEKDANDAAADFARATFGDECDAAGPQWAVLMDRRDHREPLSTVAHRQASFAAALAVPFLERSQRQLNRPVIAVCSLLPGGREQWDDVISDADLRDLSAAALGSSPTDAEIRAAGDLPSRAWADTRDRLLTAYTHAYARVRS